MWLSPACSLARTMQVLVIPNKYKIQQRRLLVHTISITHCTGRIPEIPSSIHSDAHLNLTPLHSLIE